MFVDNTLESRRPCTDNRLIGPRDFIYRPFGSGEPALANVKFDLKQITISVTLSIEEQTVRTTSEPSHAGVIGIVHEVVDRIAA